MKIHLVELATPLSDVDLAYVVGCLRSLFDRIDGHAEEVAAFAAAHVRPPSAALLAIEVDGVRAGLITLVRSAMPRYAGFAYTIEELVVLDAFRNMGVARGAIELVAERCRRDPLARKVVIRTTESAAKRAYAAVWPQSDVVTYQRMLNVL